MTKKTDEAVPQDQAGPEKLIAGNGGKGKKVRPVGAGKRGPLSGEGGAPVKKFTKQQIEGLESLAMVGATFWEMAHFLDITENTLRERIADTPEIAHAIANGKFEIQTSLRRKQLQIAMDDTHGAQPTMLIWAGKVMLGQSERVAVKIESEEDAAAVIKRLVPDFDLSAFARTD